MCACWGDGEGRGKTSFTLNLRASEKAFTGPYTIFILLNATGGLYFTKSGEGRHYIEPKV